MAKRQRKNIDISKLYSPQISNTQFDDLLNSAVTSKFIHTSYNNADIEFFKSELFKLLDAEEFIDTKDIKKFVDRLANRATMNSFTQVDFFSNKGSFSGRDRQNLGLTKTEIAEVTETTKTVINSFIADVEKAKALGTYKKDEFIQRATLIAKSETAKVNNTAVERVAKKEGFTAWIWGPSSSKHSRSEHEVLYGKKSKIGETPAPDGEYPAELPNCKCKMIFIKE